MKKLIVPVIALISLFSACKPTEPEKPNTDDNVNLTLKFTPMFKDNPVAWLSSYVNQSGDTFTIEKLKFILSDFTLEKSTGEFVTLKDAYAYLSIKAGRDSVILRAPKGDYKSIRFMVGLDSPVNHGNPGIYGLDHPLSPNLNDMHWGWAGGYIFNIFEGYFMKNGVSTGFSYHVATEKYARTHGFSNDFSVSRNCKMTFNINIDKYFDNAVQFSISNDGNTSHSGDNDPIMDKFIQNMPGIFTYDKFE